MQVTEKDGTVYGSSIEVYGPDGKPKTSGGGSPTGPAGGDLSGSYPNPSIIWNNGLPTYDLNYYPLSLNPAGYLTAITSSDVTAALGFTPYNNTNPVGFITSSALTPYLTLAVATSTYYPLSNPSGFITNAALSGYLTAATAALTYYPLTNPNAFISGITGPMVISALGFTPYNAANPAGFITSSALTPYLTSTIATLTYYPLTNPSGFINGITSNNVTTALGFIPYDAVNPAGYITSSALGPYLTASTAALTYQPILVSGTTIKTINSTSLLGSGNIAISASPYTTVGNVTGGLINNSIVNTISASILIPGNTLVATQVLQLRAQVRKIGGSGTVNVRFYINTLNSLVGATQIAQAQNMTGTGQMQRVARDIHITNATLQCYLPTNPIATDLSSAAMTSVAYVLATPYYLIAAIQCSTLLEDGTVTRLNLMTY